MRRVWVVGNTGSGKSTVAASLAERLGVPHIEIDAIHHQADWEPLEPAELRRRIEREIAGDGWIVDGNYSAVADQVRARADTIVWLDLPRTKVMRQVVTRTFRRVARREELWNGNRERWRNFFLPMPEENVILWAWTNHRRYAERYAAMAASAGANDPTFVRLRSRSQVDAFLQSSA